MNQNSRNFVKQRRIEFGNYLNSLRKKRQLKQRQVALDIGISPAKLCYIEKGERGIPDRTLEDLASKYDVPLEEMLIQKHQPQLTFLASIMLPPKSLQDLLKDLSPKEKEEVRRYIISLRLRRSTAYSP